MEDIDPEDNEVYIGTLPTYKNADGSGDEDMNESNVMDDQVPGDRKTNKKANQDKSEADKTVFGKW